MTEKRGNHLVVIRSLVRAAVGAYAERFKAGPVADVGNLEGIIDLKDHPAWHFGKN